MFIAFQHCCNIFCTRIHFSFFWGLELAKVIGPSTTYYALYWRQELKTYFTYHDNFITNINIHSYFADWEKAPSKNSSWVLLFSTTCSKSSSCTYNVISPETRHNTQKNIYQKLILSNQWMYLNCFSVVVRANFVAVKNKLKTHFKIVQLRSHDKNDAQFEHTFARNSSVTLETLTIASC